MHHPPPYPNPPVVLVQQGNTTSSRSHSCAGGSMGVGVTQLLVGLAATALFIFLISGVSVDDGSIILVIIPGPLLIITGSLGIAYGSRGKRGVAVAYLVMSILTLIFATLPASFGISAGWISFIVPPLGVGNILLILGVVLSFTSLIIASVVVCCRKPQEDRNMQTQGNSHGGNSAQQGGRRNNNTRQGSRRRETEA